MTGAREKGISASALKWIAVITMLVDHFAIAVYWQLDARVYEVYFLQRCIGRIAFPIYCFLLVEGFFHTRNVGRYIGRCLLFALLSEIPFNMAIYGAVWYPRGQNVYFTLTLGLCALAVLQKLRGRDILHIIAQLACVGVFACLAQLLEVDYHWKGVLFIVMFYYCRSLPHWVRNVVGVAAFAYEVTAPLAFIPIQLYNGKRGRQIKYLFYAIYPAHLLAYGIIRFWLNGK
ncbi:MAG: conjugal transfer protein TraX [Roseburia sp.]|nr:conjugal transfer protein TraX [Roseburia sp.]